MKRICCALALAGLSALSLAALPKWGDLGINGESKKNQTYDQSSSGYMFALAGQLQGPMQFKLRYELEDRQFYLDIVSSFYADHSRYNLAGQPVLAVTEIPDPAYAKQMKFDWRRISLDKNQSVLEFALAGKPTDRKRLTLDPDLVDVNYILFMMSDLIKRKPCDFNTNILQKTLGWRINVNLIYHAPRSPEFDGIEAKLPAKYREILGAYPDGYHIYELRPTGLIGLLADTRYYFVYANTPDSPFCGYFGGNGLDFEGIILDAPAAKG